MSTPEQLLAANEPHSALEVLQARIRERPADFGLRVFLFQLLSVLGDWSRAAAQLQLCGEMDAAALPMVNTYREALQAEAVREAVFAGKARAPVIGAEPAWLGLLAEALLADAAAQTERAAEQRALAFDQAPVSSGALNGMAFDWIADADSRLGPVLEVVVAEGYRWVPWSALAEVIVEAPVDLRDLVWAPARLKFANGDAAAALIPSRYVGSAEQADGALQLARRTEWHAMARDHYRGLGQRIFTTNSRELGVLEVRQVLISSSLPADAH